MEKKAWQQCASAFWMDIKQKIMTVPFLMAGLVITAGSYLGVIGMGKDSCFDLLVDSMPAMSDYAVFDIMAAAFVSAGGFCRDYRSGVFSSKLVREGRDHYILSQVISCVLSAGAVSVLGRIWFVILLLLKGHPFLPSEFEMQNNLCPDIFYYDRCMEQGKIPGAFLVILFSIFLFNAVCALAGLAFSAWFPNLYVVWFSPYIFLLMYKTAAYNVKQEYLLHFIGQAGSVSGSVLINIIYAAAIAAIHGSVLAFVFYYGVKRRVDNGQLKG